MGTPDSVAPHSHPAKPDLLAEDLVGTWLLDELCLSRQRRSVRPRCRGTLLYTSSGHFSATIHVSSRRIPQVGKSLGYTGTYTVERGVVTHHALVATWPFGAGSRQLRWAALIPGDASADVLRLSGDPERPVQFLLTWHRVAHAG
ncbi:lipocalin-like domain-containing protein [Amycolatopsis sp. NPDC004079]|uniref:lipocalin-like domain-containing protein n=1 Tax=Amycolatopsis sp. NPDC004079 TaxID=3154549 RepID=UPI0033B0FC25